MKRCRLHRDTFVLMTLLACVLNAAVVLSDQWVSNSATGKTEILKIINDYPECYRPLFHFTAPSGWLNDPNGLVWLNGKYHLFYQHSEQPAGGPKHWGHAVSSNLVDWVHLPIALRADKTGQAYSGCAVIDAGNTAGFGTNALLAIYTRWGGGQYLAHSTDNGRMLTDLKEPILSLPNDSMKSYPKTARDPNIIWHEPTRKWIMLLYQQVDGKGGHGYFASDNLREWTFLSHMPDFYVCPDLLELPVHDGLSDVPTHRKSWVVMDWEKYVVGDFNGTNFTARGEFQKIDHGRKQCASANQTWPARNGRTVQIAWIRGGKYPGMPFNQQMTFPCELNLRTFNGVIKLCRYPIEEIEQLHRRSEQASDDFISGPAAAFDVDIVLEKGAAESVTIEAYDQAIHYDFASETLSCANERVHCPLVGGRLELRLLVDRCSLELFANRGHTTMTSTFVPGSETTTVSIRSADGTSNVSGAVHVLKACAPKFQEEAIREMGKD